MEPASFMLWGNIAENSNTVHLIMNEALNEALNEDCNNIKFL